MSHDILGDRLWTETARFVGSLGAAVSLVIAPKEMAPLLEGTVPYEKRRDLARPEVLVIHKGMLGELGREWIEDQIDALHPAYANEVFVVLTRLPQRARSSDAPHFKSLLGMVKAMARTPTTTLVAAPPQRMAVYLGDHKALTRTIYGHKIFVDTHDIGITPHILLDGFWEQWVTDLFRSLLRPGMTVVDIGANLGYYSILAADGIGPAGRLVAFEANPGLAEFLHSNLAVNGFLDRSTIEPQAVLASSGTVRFGVFERYLGGSSIYASEDTAVSQRDKIKMIDVPTISLDAYFRPGQKIDLIKIDAEGAEPSILQGARRVLTENQDIEVIMEFAPSVFEKGYGSAGKVYEDIAAMGFAIYRIEHDGSLTEASRDMLAGIDRHWDILLRRQLT